MRIEQKDFKVYFTISLTLIFPILAIYFLQIVSHDIFENQKLYTILKAFSSIVLIFISILVLIINSKIKISNHYYRGAIAIFAIAIFDIASTFESSLEPVILLSSLSIFAGGILFSIIWMPNTLITKSTFVLHPLKIVFIILSILVISKSFSEQMPHMLSFSNQFTAYTIILNTIGGVLLIISSFFFLKQYLTEDENIFNLFFFGIALFFGLSGIFFHLSSPWDLQWWFWCIFKVFSSIVILIILLMDLSTNYNYTITDDEDEEIMN